MNVFELGDFQLVSGATLPGAQLAYQTFGELNEAKDNAIHVTYSYFVPEGKAIKHVRFNEDWVKAGDPLNQPVNQSQRQ